MRIDKRRVAIAFCAIGAFMHLYAPQAVLPMMASELNVGAASASRVITAGTLAVAATAPFTGVLSDVLGRRRVILAAMTLLIVPATMTALAPTLDQLIFWRFCHGLLLPPIFAVTIAYIADEYPPNEVNSVFGIYASASAVGGFIGRFIPGLLTDYVGWRGGFLALAGGTVVCLAVAWMLLTPERNFRRAEDLKTSLMQMLAHLRNPRLLAIFAVGFGVLFNFVATFTYLSFHLAAPPFNRSPAFLGAIFVVYLVGSVASLGLGRAIAWLGRRTFVLCVLALWSAGMLFSLIPSEPAIVVTLIIASACGILVQGSSTSFVGNVAKTGKSAAVGLYVTSFYIGGTFGGWLPGLAYEAGGWTYSLALVVAMLAIMAAIVWTSWLEPQSPQPASQVRPPGQQ
jgi:MFS transporter, YNFM family, putative membrane transport protein